jgi:hypothetical protein
LEIDDFHIRPNSCASPPSLSIVARQQSIHKLLPPRVKFAASALRSKVQHIAK